MKKLLALWLMALMLVLFSGNGALALEDPLLDGILNPTGNTIDTGNEDDDHPWGGDQSPIVPNDAPVRPSRVVVTTGILQIDQFLNAVIMTVATEVLEKPRVISPSSTVLTESTTTSQEQSALTSNSFSGKKGVTR